MYTAGGSDAGWASVAAQGNDLLSVTRPDAMMGFGITLALGLITATVAGQEYGQVAWARKRKDVSRTFLGAGPLFKPIPIATGILGLVRLGHSADPRTPGLRSLPIA